jgi:hypothetical protein
LMHAYDAVYYPFCSAAKCRYLNIEEIPLSSFSILFLTFSSEFILNYFSQFQLINCFEIALKEVKFLFSHFLFFNSWYNNGWFFGGYHPPIGLHLFEVVSYHFLESSPLLRGIFWERCWFWCGQSYNRSINNNHHYTVEEMSFFMTLLKSQIAWLCLFSALL